MMDITKTVPKTPVDIVAEIDRRLPRLRTLSPEHQRTMLLILDDAADSLTDIDEKGDHS